MPSIFVFCSTKGSLLPVLIFIYLWKKWVYPLTIMIIYRHAPPGKRHELGRTPILQHSIISSVETHYQLSETRRISSESFYATYRPSNKQHSNGSEYIPGLQDVYIPRWRQDRQEVWSGDWWQRNVMKATFPTWQKRKGIQQGHYAMPRTPDEPL